MARKTVAALQAPQSKAEALALAEEYARLDADVAGANNIRSAAIATANAVADAVVVPHVDRQKAIVAQLGAWWAVAGGELTGGKRKSIEFGGCLMGERTSPPKLSHRYKTDKLAVAAILAERLRLHRLVLRTKLELDKPIILRLLGIKDKLSARLAALGFKAVQSEEFFLERASTDAAPTVSA